MTDEALAAAWAAVPENTPEGWYVGQPMEHPERNPVEQVRHRSQREAHRGKRSREWTAVGQMGLHCIQTMGLLPR
jgi:hypothetical protein